MTRRKVRPVASTSKAAWQRSSWVPSLGSGLLLWAAFPPLGLSWLAWIAPCGWLQLCRVGRLPGRRPYRQIWVGSAAHWLAMLIGITYAHWANTIGWLVLASYLAFYVPLFVALTRVAVHRLRVPLVLAAPVVWTGLELLRGHLFTGFSMALLGHSQFEWTRLIQLADVFGAYGISFLVLFVAACILEAVFPQGGYAGHEQVASEPRGAGIRKTRSWGWTRIRLSPLVGAAVVLAAALGYASLKRPSQPTARPLKVALIQHSFNTRFEYDPERNNEIFREYRDLTLQTRTLHPDLNLILWPESVFTANMPEVILRETAAVEEDQRDHLARLEAAFRDRVRDAARGLNGTGGNSNDGPSNVSFLVGTETMIFGRERRVHNSALLVGPQGKIRGRYYKMHPVMFGEYVPFADRFPWIYELMPLKQGLTPGGRPQCFEVNGVRLAPNICFESTVPHLVRRQLNFLKRAGTSPDVLVNLTHDGWFWGSAILDFQLACAVFRSVELRRPYLVAANAGISAWIDERGRIRLRGPRQGARAIIATIASTGTTSWYTWYGDLPAAVCLFCCLALAATPLISARRRAASRSTPAADPQQPARVRRRRKPDQGGVASV